MPDVLLLSGLARISTGLRKNRKAQMREALFRLSCSFSSGTSRAVFNSSSVRRFLGLGTSARQSCSFVYMCIVYCKCVNALPWGVHECTKCAGVSVKMCANANYQKAIQEPTQGNYEKKCHKHQHSAVKLIFFLFCKNV